MLMDVNASDSQLQCSGIIIKAVTKSGPALFVKQIFRTSIKHRGNQTILSVSATQTEHTNANQTL